MYTVEECLRRARIAEQAANQLEIPEYAGRLREMAAEWRQRAASRLKRVSHCAQEHISRSAA